MTDAETITRVRASDMSPGEFLDALEDTQELPPLFPSDGDYAFVSDELVRIRDERDVWRVSAISSWVLLGLVMLALSCD